jgi:DNA polymerase-1
MKINQTDKVYLIDGSSFLYRAFYGLQPMHTTSGAQIHAVFGFCRMLKKLLDQYQPKAIMLIWDSKGRTERHELYPEYKSTRQIVPSELMQQKDKIMVFADLIGLQQIAQTGIEADDIIYSLAQDYSQAGHEVVVVSSDKDLYQLVKDPKIIVLDLFKNITIDKLKFQELYNFPVEKLAFFYALVGDTSDNIPGVRGIGKQGAQILVNQFEDLDDLYNNLDQVASARSRTALETYESDADLSWQLFSLKYYSFNIPVQDLKFKIQDWIKAREFFTELDFKSLLKDLPVVPGAIVQAPYFADTKKYKFETIATEQQLGELCKKLSNCHAFAVDTETLGLDPFNDDIIGISICLEPGTAYYVPFGHTELQSGQLSNSNNLGSNNSGTLESQSGINTGSNLNVKNTGALQLSFLNNNNILSDSNNHQKANIQLERKLVLDSLKVFLEDPKYQKYLHNAKFDQLVLWSAGIKLTGITFDTMLAASLVAENSRRVGLKYLSEHYLGDNMLTYDQVVTDQKLTSFAQVSLELATKYAAADAHQVLLLQKILAQELQAKNLTKVFAEIELPVSQVLFEMECAGIYLDCAELAKLGLEVDRKIEQLKVKLQALAELAPDFNFNAPRQIEELLFQKLNLPAQKKNSKTGSYSTDQEVLVELAKIHAVPGLILQYRELSKLKNTYIDKLPETINPKTNKIHTSFSQVITATGRLASSNPNLQNIPADGDGLGLQVRAAFKPDPGYVFLAADYSQIELRVLAQLSSDQHLIQAFRDGLDIHAQTAAKIFGVDLTAVTKEQRQLGKRINFSVLYGLTAFGLAKDLNLDLADAKTYIATYFAQYPGVSTWMDQVVAETERLGYVETLWGRRRYIPEIYEKNKNLYNLGRRLAINTKAQGTAAEIVKLGMLAVDSQLKQANLGAKILLQIHDELLIMVPVSELQATETLIKAALEGVVAWQIPLEVNLKTGANWSQVTK